jgi:intracellular sulfur oxidation DsrE/DsrF family protein
LAATLILAVSASAQQQTKAGPIIESGGAVYQVQPDLATPTDREYKVAFEIATPAPSPERLNASINTVARFLNMHGQAGVPADQVHGAIVVHGGAVFEFLDDAGYREKFGVDNPNADLIRELIASGQPVLMCGQSAASRGVDTEKLIPGVQVALSAMTAFLLLQDDGYRVNPW